VTLYLPSRLEHVSWKDSVHGSEGIDHQRGPFNEGGGEEREKVLGAILSVQCQAWADPRRNPDDNFQKGHWEGAKSFN
jgi:hypothetical protein